MELQGLGALVGMEVAPFDTCFIVTWRTRAGGEGEHTGTSGTTREKAERGSWHCRPGQTAHPPPRAPAGHADLMPGEQRPPARLAQHVPSDTFLRPPSSRVSAEGDAVTLWATWASPPGALTDGQTPGTCVKGLGPASGGAWQGEGERC